jgi:hypothetical protein
MRRTWDPTIPAVLAAIIMLVGTVAATGGIPPGEWRGRLSSDRQFVRLDLRLVDGNNQTRLSTDVAATELDGFDAAAFARSGAPLRLTWKRDAGTFVFEGEGGRRAGGKVRFEPDATFAARWSALGFGPLASNDYLRLAEQNIRLDDARRLKELGYGPLDMNDLIRLGSEPDAMKWLEEMHSMGLRLEVGDVFRFRSHGVSLDYVKGVIDAGVAKDDLEGILRLHAHGVPTDYVARVRSSGYPGVDVDDLIRLHDQGVDADYVHLLVDSHLPELSLDDVIRLHAHGVPADYARAIVEIGPGRRDADDVIRLHEHGVSADFIRSLARTARRDLTVDDVIRASNRGLTSLSDPAVTGETQ